MGWVTFVGDTVWLPSHVQYMSHPVMCNFVGVKQESSWKRILDSKAFFVEFQQLGQTSEGSAISHHIIQPFVWGSFPYNGVMGLGAKRSPQWSIKSWDHEFVGNSMKKLFGHSLKTNLKTPDCSSSILNANICQHLPTSTVPTSLVQVLNPIAPNLICWRPQNRQAAARCHPKHAGGQHVDVACRSTAALRVVSRSKRSQWRISLEIPLAISSFECGKPWCKPW